MKRLTTQLCVGLLSVVTFSSSFQLVGQAMDVEDLQQPAYDRDDEDHVAGDYQHVTRGQDDWVWNRRGYRGLVEGGSLCIPAYRDSLRSDMDKYVNSKIGAFRFSLQKRIKRKKEVIHLLREAYAYLLTAEVNVEDVRGPFTRMALAVMKTPEAIAYYVEHFAAFINAGSGDNVEKKHYPLAVAHALATADQEGRLCTLPQGGDDKGSFPTFKKIRKKLKRSEL